MRKLSEFTCGISGDRCVTYLNEDNIEICVLKEEYEKMREERKEAFANKVTFTIVVLTILYFGGHVLVHLIQK